jgi:hypothetical protein
MAEALTVTGPLDGLRKRTGALADGALRLAKAEPRASIAVGLGAIAALTAGTVQLLAPEPVTAPPAPSRMSC